MSNSSLLESIQHETKSPATHVVIWLHGLGADGGDFAPMVPELRLPDAFAVRFIFPHAPIRPITINNGYEMRGWYDISSLAIRGEIDEDGILESIATVNEIITAQNKAGVSSDRIIIGGFSQGAVMALRTGLQLETPVAGVMAISGYLPLQTPINENITHFPIFLAHGTEDTVVPYALGKAAYMNLKQAGFDVDWHTYPVGHNVSAPEINDISQWIQKIFSQK